MAYVPIPKDFKKIQTKVVFNLTRRQLIGFLLVGIVGFYVYRAMNSMMEEFAMMLTIIVTLPIFFVIFFEKDGMKFEQYFYYFYLYQYYQPKKRVREAYLYEEKRKYTKKEKRKKCKR